MITERISHLLSSASTVGYSRAFVLSRLFHHHRIMSSVSSHGVPKDGSTFFYFAFGSNLLAARIHLLNPSAVFDCIARLENYRLDFDYSDSETWRGAAATITESPDDHMWGVVWTIKKADLPNLDIQEGVDLGIYEPKEVMVTSQDDRRLLCRTYNLLRRGSADKRPSPQYLDVIVRGAIQHRLPEYYISKLEAIEHNGFPGPVPLYDQVISCHMSSTADSNNRVLQD